MRVHMKAFMCACMYVRTCMYKPVHVCISVYMRVAWLYTSENYTQTALSTYGDSYPYVVITKQEF